MKTTNILNVIVLSIGILFLIVPSLSAQDCKCPEVEVFVQDDPISVMTVISESDYPYLLNVKNLKKY